MANIVEVDNVVVSLIAVIAIFLVLLVTFRSVSLPFILLLAIESGIWINLSIPYFTGTPLNFIGYLVVNTVQLGATIDYGILLTTHYLRERKSLPARAAARAALGKVFPVGARLRVHPRHGGFRACGVVLDRSCFRASVFCSDAGRCSRCSW